MRDRATDTPCLPCLHPDAALEITRNDVLARQLIDIEFKPGTRDCKVAAGILHDPYTGSTIDDLGKIQIDHILSAALSRDAHIFAGHSVDAMPLMRAVGL